MNNKNQTFKELINFIQGKEHFAILQGANNQFDDASTALAAIFVCFFNQKSNILFRTNCVKDIEPYLSQALSGFWDGSPENGKFKKRVKEAVKNRTFSIGSMSIFIDTINPRSQITTPGKINAAILYPAEEFMVHNILEKSLVNLYEKGTEKIIFCARGESIDFDEIKYLNPVRLNSRKSHFPGDFMPALTLVKPLNNLSYSYC